ncbi:MAG: GAF domain-containing protein [Rehaibacterium terrae]|uniref:GAF domain-containing protein n=1 Tax=Rehaibacterium terrae TaxID=1341696 RepID=UPI00391BC8C5
MHESSVPAMPRSQAGHQARLRPFHTFHEVAETCLDLLALSADMALWMLTRSQGSDWILLALRDRHYGLVPGQVLRWQDALCRRTVDTHRPVILGDLADAPDWRQAPIARALPIRSYIGIPVSRADGGLFGTFCAFDPEPRSLRASKLVPVLVNLSRAITTWLMLQSELESCERELLRRALTDRVDSVTGLLDSDGWQRMLDYEQLRLDQLPTGTGILALRLHDNGQTEYEDQLRTFAGLLRLQLSLNDSAAYLGGGDFVVALPQVCPGPLAEVTARIRSALPSMRLTVDIGQAWSGLRGNLTRTWREAELARDRQRG